MMTKKGSKGKKRKDWIGKFFEVLGLVVAASPVIQGVAEHVGDPQNIPAAVAYHYTGYNINTGGWNQQDAVKGVATVAAGGVIAGIPRIFRVIRNMIKGR